MAVLETHELTAFYGDFQALFGITFALDEGETVAIIGANGAGKSTFLKAIAGLLPRAGRGRAARRPRYRRRCRHTRSSSSALRWCRKAGGCSPRFRSRKICWSAPTAGAPAGRGTSTAVYRLFPVLRERRHTPSTALSGGQQQMVAIGRSLMSNPRILLCDELSLGLAPIVIRDIYAALADIKQRGTSVVLVEQDLVHAMSVADRAYCFQEGRVSLTGRPQELTRDAIHAAYFGL